MKLDHFAKEYLAQLRQAADALDPVQLEGFADALYEAYQAGRQIFVLGNGGSAACATHWVCDFNKGINTPGSKRARMLCLSDNTGIVTALGNDISYDEIFSYQLQNLAQPGDLVVALSVSGNSPNLVRAMEYAKSIGCRTIAALGDYNGRVGKMVDCCLWLPSKNYGVAEDLHLILGHILSQYFHAQNLKGEA